MCGLSEDRRHRSFQRSLVHQIAIFSVTDCCLVDGYQNLYMHAKRCNRDCRAGRCELIT